MLGRALPLGVFGFLLSVVTAILFSGFVMYDMQRLRYAREGVDDPITSSTVSAFSIALHASRSGWVNGRSA